MPRRAVVVRKDMNYTKTERGERILWCVLEDDAQEAVLRILGRKLSEDELHQVKRALEFGLEDWWITQEVAIRDLKAESEEYPIPTYSSQFSEIATRITEGRD